MYGGLEIEKAQIWGYLLAAHGKWMRDYNFQKHMAHEKRDDGCHSPAAVLGWIKGVQPGPELVYQACSGLCEMRRLNKAGYVRFRNFFLYGERNLAGETVQVDILKDILTLDYRQEKLSRYSVEWQPDDRHFRRVGNPRLYDHRYQSAQLELWQPSEVEWFVIIRDHPWSRRRRRKNRILLIQPLLPIKLSGTAVEAN